MIGVEKIIKKRTKNLCGGHSHLALKLKKEQIYTCISSLGLRGLFWFEINLFTGGGGWGWAATNCRFSKGFRQEKLTPKFVLLAYHR